MMKNEKIILTKSITDEKLSYKSVFNMPNNFTNKKYFGSWKENEVAGFVVFSQYL